MKVRNLISKRNNRPIANQFIIETEENGTDLRVLNSNYAKDVLYDIMYFQSYKSIIVKIVYGGRRDVYLDNTYWNYSRTTGKYRNQFLGETKQETEEKIKSGEYILTDLNR